MPKPKRVVLGVGELYGVLDGENSRCSSCLDHIIRGVRILGVNKTPKALRCLEVDGQYVRLEAVILPERKRKKK